MELVKITIKYGRGEKIRAPFSFYRPMEKTEMPKIHQEYAEMYPDSFVNFETANGDFIAGARLNEQKDGELVNSGLLTWDEYCLRWYPSLNHKTAQQ